MAKSESSGESANFKKVALGVIILLVLGVAAYFLVKSEFFQGITRSVSRPAYDVEMAKVSNAVTVREGEDCAEGEDFCTWPIETKKETSFDVKKDATFEVLTNPDGAPSGTLRALKAYLHITTEEQENNSVAIKTSENSEATNTEIVKWRMGINDRLTDWIDIATPIEQGTSVPKTVEEQQFEFLYEVKDAAGRSDSFETTITIPAKEVAAGQGIVAVCKWVNDGKAGGYGYNFGGTLQNTDGSYLTYNPGDYTWQWNLDDESEEVEGQTVEHTYAPGTYTPVLTVTDSEGTRYAAQCSNIAIIQPGLPVRQVPGYQLQTLNSVLDAATRQFPAADTGDDFNVNDLVNQLDGIRTKPPRADTATTNTAEGPTISAETIDNGGPFIVPTGSTVYFEADCSPLDAALRISTTATQRKVREAPAGLPSISNTQPRLSEPSPFGGLIKKSPAPTKGFDLGDNIKRPADTGAIETERSDTSIASDLNFTNADDVRSRLENFTTGEIITATLGIKPNEFACVSPVEEPPVEEPPVEKPPVETPTITPACQVDKNAILTGEDIVFTGRGSEGPYVKAVLNFGDGTADIELNVPAQEAALDISDIPTEVIEGLKDGRITQYDGRMARRIPMEESLGQKRDVPPVISIKQTDIDEVQTFQTHTYDAAGAFTITLTLVDKDGQAKTCDTSVDVADPVIDGDPVYHPQCSDGLDNDGDGFIDFIVGAGDPGCDDPTDDDETNKKEIITDEPPRLPFCLAYTTPQRYVDVSTQNNAYDVIKEESSTAYNGAYEDFVGQAIFHGYKTANNKRVFKPQQGILRSEAAKIVMHATCYADALLEYDLLDDTNIPYKDVPATHWADQIINIMSNAGIFDADKDYNYPNNHTTRAEFIKLLVEVHVQTVGDELHAFRADENPFVDVEAGAWYAPYIQTAVDYGIALESKDFTFRPDRIVTREDAAVWIYNYFAAVADATFGEKREGETGTPESETESGRVAPIRR